MGCLHVECCHICHFLIQWCCLPAGSMHKWSSPVPIQELHGRHAGVSLGKGLALPPGDSSLQGTASEIYSQLRFTSDQYRMS